MVLKTTGPTTTPQLKPEILTGYKNIAEGAVVSVSEGDGSTYLNDVSYHYSMKDMNILVKMAKPQLQ